MRFKNMVLSTAVALLMLCTSLPTAQARPYNEDIPDYIDVVVASHFVDIAEDYLGVSYCRGGTSPRCFDCSGFTQYVYAKNGIDIPRVADAQYRSATPVPSDEAVPGDLVFFLSGGYVYHVGIYVGNGKVLHSPKPGRRVHVETIWTSNIRFGKF
jgi:cell wall-associated NlpC family hydrolase